MEKDSSKIAIVTKNILLLVAASLFLVLLQSHSFALNPLEKEREYKASQWNKQAVEALNKGRFLVAIDFLQRALELVPDNETVKNNLAVAYNNYALKLNEEENVEAGKKYLYKAIEIEPQNSQYKQNLTNIIYAEAERFYQEGDYSTAAKELQELLALSPKHTPGLILLGQIYYQKQELNQAKTLWEEAYKHNPKDTNLRKLLSRLKKEEKVETQLKQLDAYYFDIRFDKEAVDSEIYDIRFYLREVYRDIGRDFNYYPKHKIPVILYTQEDFKTLRKTPDWVAGIFDGKIRLPVKKETLTETEIRRLIWHEYTHAIIMDLSQGNCPIWFNEGLAKWEESKQQPPDLTPLKKAVEKKALIPLTKLESCFSLHTSQDRLNLAYLEAYSFIEFMLDRWTFYTIREILTQLKEGKSIEQAFWQQLNRSINQLDRNWREYLQKRYCQ